MEDNDQTIESGDETSGVDAPSEEGGGGETPGFDAGEQPSEATQWAQDAEAEDDESGYDPDEDIESLGDEDSGQFGEQPSQG